MNLGSDGQWKFLAACMVIGVVTMALAAIGLVVFVGYVLWIGATHL